MLQSQIEYCEIKKPRKILRSMEEGYPGIAPGAGMKNQTCADNKNY